MDDVPFILPTLPDAWRRSALAHLDSGEVIHAWFTPDLASPLRYASGLVLLTDRRVLSAQRDSEAREEADTSNVQWESWPLSSIANVRAKERSGLGTLDLLGTDSRLASWRYTNGLATSAHEFVRCFDAVRRGLPLESVEPEDSESFAQPAEAPVSTKSLWRLARFARQRAGLILLGFVLTVATTTAGLIPTYLTVPLMGGPAAALRRVRKDYRAAALTPAMREKALDLLQDHDGPTFGRLVSLCLLGMAAAAVAAWLLGWAQGIVMSRVSERIAGDLRNQTYAHLHKLSLEFFGGKRTGDLIARISSDTDRICNFLADNVVDFASDILMFIGMSVILFTWDPLLALAGLLPLPLVGWLVYYVRGQLQHGFSRGGRAWSEMTNVLADTIPGIRVVKAFAQEKREIRRFEAANDRVVEANNRVNMVWAFFWPLVLFFEHGRLAGRVGLWRVAGLRLPHRARVRGRLLSVHHAVLHPAGIDEPDVLDDAARRGQLAAHLRNPRSRPQRGRTGGAGEPGRIPRRDRAPRRRLPLWQSSGDRERRPDDRAGRNGRARRTQRLGQEHPREFGLPLLRRHAGLDPRRWCRRPAVPRVRFPPEHRRRAARSVLVLRHDLREHRLRTAGCHARGNHRRGPRRQGPRVHHAPDRWL